MNNTLNVMWCYPDILNLHGDRGNIMALEKVSKLLGVNLNIIKVDDFKIDFDNADIILFNPGELRTLDFIINTLNEQKKELKKYVDSNKVLVAIGTSGAIFSNRVIRIDKGDLVGLELLDMNCYEREKVLGDDLIVNVKDTDIKLVGNQVQVMDTVINSDISFSDVLYGYGNNGNDDEGARYKNLIFTNMLGPVFVKNPWFVEYIIKLAMKNKKIELKEVDKEEYEIELKSLELIEKYNEEK